jgi:F420-dependent oxidoreductase-like protein
MRLSVGVEGQEGMSWAEFLALARRVEDLGFGTLFRSDHYSTVVKGSSCDAHDAWASLAAVAAATDRIRLGTMVSPVTFRHPSVLARMAATVDHISGGRVEVGLGAGWYAHEHAAHGFPFSDVRTRFELLEEQVEIVVRSWTEERFDFSGAHYTLRDCVALPRPVQRPHPPLILAGSARPRSAALAARWAQEYNTVFATLEECRERRLALDGACLAAGRDPSSLTLSLLTRCIVGRNRSDTQERLERVLAIEASEAPGESWLVGTADEVASQLDRLGHVGVDHVILHQLDHRDLEMFDVIAKHLLPVVA